MDSHRDYQQAFERQISELNRKTSYGTVIEEFIEKSEKEWFNRLRGVQMGKSKTPVGSIFQDKESGIAAESMCRDGLDHDQNIDEASRS